VLRVLLRLPLLSPEEIPCKALLVNALRSGERVKGIELAALWQPARKWLRLKLRQGAGAFAGSGSIPFGGERVKGIELSCGFAA
jgi:hypothetical protein